MSPSAAANAKAIANYENFLRGNYCSMSARVLFLWDYLVTLEDEVRYVWGRKITAATVLFVLNRYVNLLITILELLEQAPFQTAECSGHFARDSCGPFIRVLQSLLVFALLIVAIFASLRVYAIWHCNWRLAVPVFVLALVPVAINIFLDASEGPQLAPPPSVGCAINLRSITGVQQSKWVIVNRATATAYDGIVLGLTLLRTVGVRKQASRAQVRTDIIGLLIQDGSIYFLALMIINIAQIIISAEVAGNNYLAYYVSPVTSILISRFLLDLRRVSSNITSPHDRPYASRYLTSDTPSINFNSDRLGGLDGPLDTFSFIAETNSGTGTTELESECITQETGYAQGFEMEREDHPKFVQPLGGLTLQDSRAKSEGRSSHTHINHIP